MDKNHSLTRAQLALLAVAALLELVLAAVFGCSAFEISDVTRGTLQAFSIAVALLSVSILIEDQVVRPLLQLAQRRNRGTAA
ncbi:hypothetical protein [Ramlibacter albus]|uniref:Uncharacterized protein n=1 Tax=Ramlibacter albus TaxID=2079448 RepID=A0A923S4I5_9BURK|nr:hypothetical protein [Ramlibacter albus]MBC5767540.1 hypothetical protein [Ramlibacter albus]